VFITKQTYAPTKYKKNEKYCSYCSTGPTMRKINFCSHNCYWPSETG